MLRSLSWKKRKFSGNQHGSNTSSTKCLLKQEVKKDSSNFLKLNSSSLQDKPEDNSDISGYRLIDVKLLEKLILSCSVFNVCKQGSLKLEEQSFRGLASTLKLTCLLREKSSQEATSRMLSSNTFDVNMRFIYGMRSTGKARKASVILCAVMELMPPPSFLTTTKRY